MLFPDAMMRVFSLVLSVCLLLGGCAFATETDTEDDVIDCPHENVECSETLYDVCYTQKDERSIM